MDTSLFLLSCHAHALHLEYHSDEYTGRGQLHILYLGVQAYVHTKPDKLKTQLSFFGFGLRSVHHKMAFIENALQ